MPFGCKHWKGCTPEDSMDRDFRNLATRIAVLVAIAGAPIASARSAPFDDFEGPQVSWQIGDADVGYQLLRHQRIAGEAHAGRGSELVQITGGAGTFVYITRNVGSARIVAELKPQVWVKADRPGIQLLARIVLPHTPDPRTGRPAAVLIRGTSYTSTGVWQMLQIADTPLLLTRQLRVLQTEMKSPIDGREAYIDQLLLNIYGGPGQTTVNIDDLDIPGIVAREDASALPTTASSAERPAFRGLPGAATSSVRPVSNSTPAATGGRPDIALNGSLLEIDGRPMFPRIIQSQGEPLALLKQLGFNAVRTGGPLTDSMLDEARRAGIWLIGPPPVVQSQMGDAPAALAPISGSYDPVLAWHLGSNLAARELASTTQLAKQLRQADRQLRRPLLCSAEENVMAFSRQVDLLSVCRNPLASSLELKDYSTWLAQRPRLARPGTPLWTVVQTEPAPSVIEQAAELSGRQAPEPVLDLESLRLVAYQAFSAGARGIEFASNSRLDAGDVATRNRAAALALLNLEMQLLEPWEAAGSVVGNVSSNDSSISGVVLSADNARLVVALRCPEGSQFVAAPTLTGTALPPPAGSIPMSLEKNDAAKNSQGSSALRSSSRPLEHGASANTLQSNRTNNRSLPDGSPNPNGLTPPPPVGTYADCSRHSRGQ